MKMVQQCERSPSFSKAVLVLTCLCALSCPSFVHPVSKYDNQDGAGKDDTALDLGKPTPQVRNIKQLVEITLDERTLLAFPIERDGYIEWINIAKEIGISQSAEFGVQLFGMENVNMVDEIVTKYTVTANIHIFWEWLSGKGRKPVTFRTLIDVLHEIGLSELANRMTNTCEILKIMDVKYIPAIVKKYSRHLSEKYKQDAVIDKEQWLLKRLHGQNITFVELEFKEKGSNILLSDLLHDVESGARLLFVGRPGVGKSTFMRHLSRRLIYTDQFYLVVRLHLSGSGKIDSLSTLLQVVANESFPDKVFDSKEISSYTERTRGDGVCFLLDGYDEYVKPPDGYDYVTSLIKRTRLPKSVVIVTSRPSAVEDIEAAFDKNVEIIGFGERGIQAYLEQLELSQTENQTIHQYLDAHPDVRKLCYLPLHLSMLVYIAISPIDTGILSLLDTETELYTEFLTLTIKQYEPRHEQTELSLKECLNDLYTRADLCVLLQKISEKAFDGVISREKTFISSSLNGLPDSINTSAKIEALSLFKIETIYDRYGRKLEKYYYPHPTFQEFLAAFHLATLHTKDHLIYVKSIWTRGMYKFFFGLIGSQLRYDDETVFQTFVSFAREYLATYLHQELYIMKCAHEIGRSSQYVTYLQAAGVITNNNSLHLHVPSYQLHDCWYIGYTLSQSPLYELAVDKFFPSRELALCLSFIKTYFKHDRQILRNVNVITLGHYANRKFPFNGYWLLLAPKEDPISTTEILEFLPAFHKDVTHLELTFSIFEHSPSVSRLGEILKSFKKLQFLALTVNISVIKDGHLERALRNVAHLEHLELGVINGHNDTTIPGDLLEFKSLKQLQSLMVCINWNNDQVDVNMTALIGGLKYLTNLESLSISLIQYNGFRHNGPTELLRGIEKVSQVKNLALHLNLCENLGLGNATAKELAAALKNLTMLKHLSLCIDVHHNGIQGPIDVIELAEALKKLTELQGLSLILRWLHLGNNTVDEAAIALADGLKQLRNLSALELSLYQNGSFSEIAPILKSHAQFQEVKLERESPGGKTDDVKLIDGLLNLMQILDNIASKFTIEDHDVVPLVEALKYMDHLHTLDLSHNKIGDDDVVSIVEVLSSIDHLHTLDLSHNNIGDAGVKLLAKAMKERHLTHLQVLLLDWNEFSEAGAKTLAEKVLKLSQLHTLDFGWKFGVYSARALALIHHQNEAISNPVLASDISDEKWHMLYFVITLVVSALVGGVLCFKAFNRLLLSEISNYKAFESNEISEALAQSIFSTSYAWKLERLRERNLDGTGTVIVILDTAVDLRCPAFLHKNPPVTVFDCLQHLQPPSTMHGSVCAAVAVGSSYNTPSAVVPSGVAPGARLIVYRIAESEHSYNEAVLRALDDLKVKIESGTQIDVVSISYDLNEDSKEEIRWKIKGLTEKGVVFVAAAGNRGCYQAHASIPARFDSVISVGALDKNGFPSRFNARGRIDVYAPGEDIPMPSLTQGTFRGTSFAAPAVGGLVLLLKQCANHAGLPASNHIHQVEILREIFQKHMITKSDDGQVDVFDPVGFFLHVIDNPNLLNEIVQEHLNLQHMEQ